MVASNMESIIHYRHSLDEVAELAEACGPMMGSIKVVATGYNRQSLKRIVGCEFFRAREASAVKSMLLRAVKHARATLHEIFPLMQQDVLIKAQNLEDAANRYWANFQRLRQETLPVH
jgi:ABC-type molybdate transport system ATPase subunit